MEPCSAISVRLFRYPHFFPAARRAQRGFLLLVTLVMLAIMGIVSLSLTRTVGTSVAITGSIAEQVSMRASATAAINQAQSLVSRTGFDWNSSSGIYYATRHETNLSDEAWRRGDNPAGSCSGLMRHCADRQARTIWSGISSASKGYIPPDEAGNTVKFFIERQCNGDGVPYSTAAGPHPSDCATFAFGAPLQGDVAIRNYFGPNRRLHLPYLVYVQVTNTRGAHYYTTEILHSSHGLPNINFPISDEYVLQPPRP